MAQKDTRNRMIVFIYIFFIQLRRRDFLGCYAKSQIKQKGVAEKAPQHDPQSVLRFAEMTDEPAGNKYSLHQADKHGKVVGNGIFEKWYFHNASALSIIKLK